MIINFVIIVNSTHSIYWCVLNLGIFQIYPVEFVKDILDLKIK